MNTSVPSGYEVHSASFHPPVSGDGTAVQGSGHGRLDELKSKALTVTRSLNTRRTEWTERAASSLTAKKDEWASRARDGAGRVRTSMARQPMKWAGIAAASGLAIGLAGRYLQWRSESREIAPTLVIVESSC